MILVNTVFALDSGLGETLHCHCFYGDTMLSQGLGVTKDVVLCTQDSKHVEFT